MNKTHKVEIKIEEDGVIKMIKGEMRFSNGVKQSFEYTELPFSCTVAAADEFAHLLKHIDTFNKQTEGKIITLEITKK